MTDQTDNRRLRVAVIAGGPSNEREVSLKTGEQVLRNLDPSRYEPSFIEISTDGRWFERISGGTRPIALMSGERPLVEHGLKGYDIVFNALHGYFGEDGKIQALLELLHVPYTGSGVAASALGMDKMKTTELARLAGITVPDTLIAHERGAEAAKNIMRDVDFPCVVKPNASGSSVGVSMIAQPDELPAALDTAFAHDFTVLVQRRIRGREITCGVLGNAGRELTTLPPIEIVAAKDFFDFEAKYNSSETREICPAEIPPATATAVQEAAQRMHELLGCDGLTRSDFILGEDGALYFLELNTLPGLTEVSLCPKEAKALGWSYGELLDRIIALALEKRR
jgi:D-alanine-D-alanine ligase